MGDQRWHFRPCWPIKSHRKGHTRRHSITYNTHQPLAAFVSNDHLLNEVYNLLLSIKVIKFADIGVS